MSITSPKSPDTISMDEQSNSALDLTSVLAASLGAANVLPLRSKDEALLDDMKSFRFGPNESRQAWSIGDGPTVVLVHGYSGRGVQMATLARRLSTEGFRCVLFDAGGHGISATEKIGFFTFMNDTRDLFAYLDTQVHALIGHSAGALGMMRARALYHFSAEKYCVMNAPLFPYVPLESMRATGAPEEALDYVKAILSDQFQMSWSSLVAGESFTSEPDRALLAIYDTSDKMVRHSDADALGAIWPDTKIVKTDGYGHNRILQAQETLDAVASFVRR